MFCSTAPGKYLPPNVEIILICLFNNISFNFVLLWRLRNISPILLLGMLSGVCSKEACYKHE